MKLQNINYINLRSYLLADTFFVNKLKFNKIPAKYFEKKN